MSDLAGMSIGMGIGLGFEPGTAQRAARRAAEAKGLATSGEKRLRDERRGGRRLESTIGALGGEWRRVTDL